MKKTFDDHFDSYVSNNIYYIIPPLKDLKAAKEHNTLF